MQRFQQIKYTGQRYVIEVSIRTIETENPQFMLTLNKHSTFIPHLH